MSKLEEKYDAFLKKQKEKIAKEPDKIKKFWKKVWHFISFPFVWFFYNIRDWRTAVIFGICFLLLSSEVWIPFLAGFIFPHLKAPLWAFAGAAWLFWIGPGTPFSLLCISMTIGVKGIFNKIRSRRKKS